MAVAAMQAYQGVPRDAHANYNGNQLLYFCWDQHLLFAAPFILYVSPEMRLGDLIAGHLGALLSPDPDASKIDWKDVTWSKGKQAWQPDFNLSLAENGIRHKDQLRMQTPGLNTLVPTA